LVTLFEGLGRNSLLRPAGGGPAPGTGGENEQPARNESESGGGAPGGSTPAGDFQAMRDKLRDGTAVQVAVAPHLFPTPRHVAAPACALLPFSQVRQTDGRNCQSCSVVSYEIAMSLYWQSGLVF
jgi:hypothetical protein